MRGVGSGQWGARSQAPGSLGERSHPTGGELLGRSFPFLQDVRKGSLGHLPKVTQLARGRAWDPGPLADGVPVAA